MDCKNCGEPKKILAKGLCEKCYRSAYRKANLDKQRASYSRWAKANPEKVRAAAAAWAKANPEKVRAAKAAWDKANPGKYFIQNREYYRANKEKIRAQKAQYRNANKEKIKAADAAHYKANKEKIRVQKAGYVKANLAKWRFWGAARKARKSRATPSWADKALIKDMYAEAGYQQMHVDHIVPLRSKRVCGLHWEGNMQLLAPTDNISKGNRHWPGM